MKRPKNFCIGSIEIRLFDVGTNDLSLRALDDGNGLYLEMRTTDLGVVLERGDLQGIADLGEALLDLYDAMNSEAPDAGDEPATGITPTADKEPLI